ncbi:MAG: hypothetical protein MSH22_00210 [Spirochaetia bacterium]|nr:hypothetical protein [Spirochaetia bacterium]
MKKLITLLTALFLSVSSLFPLPGFPPYIQELPGQYVYYEDKTFQRKSYFGLLQFDEKTFAARYYAPFDAKEKKPETDVEIYFTIDPKADHMELTGEKIMSGFTPEEAEIINYLHDMIYELSARRKKIGALSENKRIVRNDEYFGQFGGFVTVEYDAIVPLFNIKQVFSDESAPEFFIVTAGQLTSATDKSFEKFKGFPEKLQDAAHKIPKSKKLTPLTFKTEDGKSILLDSSWTQSMDNVFMQGDAALISVSTIPHAPIDFLIRQLLLSTEDSYLNWNLTEITEENGKIKINGLYYQPSTKNLSRNYKIAMKNNSYYDFVTMTVYYSIFEKNRKYYINIINKNSEKND